MSDAALIESIAVLGAEFSRRGWDNRVPPLREFYAAVKAGRSMTEAWNEEHLLWWLRVLGLRDALAVLPRGSPCPRCKLGEGERQLTRTRAALEDRYVVACGDCGLEWVEMHPHPPEPPPSPAAGQ